MWDDEVVMQFLQRQPGQKLKNLETSRVLALFSDSARAEVARRALIDAGFSETSVGAFSGRKGMRDLDLKGEHHGVVQHMRQLWHHLLHEERLQWEQFEQALAAGESIVQVKTDPATSDLAHTLLRSSGGHFIHFFGLLTTKTLDP